MNRITTLPELIEFIPKILEIHEQLYGRWNSGISPEQLRLELMEKFKTENEFYGKIIDNKLAYFIALEKSLKKCHFWILYIDIKYRESSKKLVQTVINNLQTEGFLEITFTSTRMQSSYRRWVAKFGAFPVSINYKINLLPQ